MLTGLADAHVKSGIVDGVRRRGMDIVTAQELGQSRAKDEELLSLATQAKLDKLLLRPTARQNPVNRRDFGFLSNQSAQPCPDRSTRGESHRVRGDGAALARVV